METTVNIIFNYIRRFYLQYYVIEYIKSRKPQKIHNTTKLIGWTIPKV